MKKDKKMKKIILIYCVIVLCTGVLLYPAKPAASLPDIMKPTSLSLDGDRMYIVEKSAIRIYSITDYSPVKTFGKKGEGPGEFKYTPALRITPDYVFLNAMDKCLFFSKDGSYIKELKIPGMLFGVIPLGENFVGMKSHLDMNTRKTSRCLNLYDKKLNLVKEISKKEKKRKLNATSIEVDGTRECSGYHVYDEKLFAADTSGGFFIEVFDCSGKKIYDIKKDHKKINVTDQYKKQVENEITKAFKQNGMPKPIITFNDYYPAFRDFKISNGKIYAISYLQKNGKNETFVLDLKGKSLKKVFLPKTDIYTISKGRFYYLKENEESEEWELFVETI